MTAAVDKIIEDLIAREGDYSNHRSDTGGATRWGVTEAVARSFGYTGAMRELPRSIAADIYRRRYWVQPGFSAVETIFPKAAVELFDTGVNMGPAVAAKMLQRSLNLLNGRGTWWPDMTVDGLIGAMTLEGCRRFKKQRGTNAEVVLARCLDGLQLARYADITEARPANEDFFYGWVANRIGALA